MKYEVTDSMHRYVCIVWYIIHSPSTTFDFNNSLYLKESSNRLTILFSAELILMRYRGSCVHTLEWLPIRHCPIVFFFVLVL
jgi:hypothetical protein